MAKLYNLARMSTATTGTGTITLGSAVSGCLTFALAGVANADVVSYAISDGVNSEIGTGTYTSSGTTLTRTVTKSTNANAAINLSGTAEVFITVRAEDIGTLDGVNTWSGAQILSDTTASTSTTTGAVVSAGGIAAAKKMWSGEGFATSSGGSSTISTIDASAQTAVSAANGASVTIMPNYRGMMLVSCESTGEVSLWIATTASGAVLISTTGTEFVASTTTPAAGKVSVAGDPVSGWAAYNNRGSTTTFRVISFRLV